jgi:hypothetical protein
MSIIAPPTYKQNQDGTWSYGTNLLGYATSVDKETARKKYDSGYRDSKQTQTNIIKNMAKYDVIGNVTDEKNQPIVGLIVDDGSQGIPTNSDGYYEIKTDKNILNFRMVGFKPQTFDLSKYKAGSAVNVDIVMKEDTNATTLSPLEVSAMRNVVVKEPVKTPKNALLWGLGVGLPLGAIAFLIAKSQTKSVGVQVGIGVGALLLGGLSTYFVINKMNK